MALNHERWAHFKTERATRDTLVEILLARMARMFWLTDEETTPGVVGLLFGATRSTPMRQLQQSGWSMSAGVNFSERQLPENAAEHDTQQTTGVIWWKVLLSEIKNNQKTKERERGSSNECSYS